MQRRARTRLASALLAATLAGGIGACTASSGPDTSSSGAGPEATTTAAPAPPGEYSTLPEPCGTVSRELLKQMLPGIAAEADNDSGDGYSPSPYEGEPSVTYDADRRVGCSWQSTTSKGSRHLGVDFERVVSYDPAVSDDKQTRRLYQEQLTETGITDPDRPADSTGTPEADETTRSGATHSPPTGAASSDAPSGSRSSGDAPQGGQRTLAPRQGDTPSPSGAAATPSGDHDGDDSGSPTPPSPTTDPSLRPRTLDGIGDAAFIDDQLVASANGRGSKRTVTLVFRTSNVLVTVEYSQSIANARQTPNSAELQEHARNLAQQLAAEFADN